MKRALRVQAMPIVLLTLVAGPVFADSPICGEAQDDSWMEPEAVQQQIETLGYTVESLGVSEGNCYQVTGLNVEGKSMMAYLDPRTGSVVQEDIVE